MYAGMSARKECILCICNEGRHRQGERERKNTNIEVGMTSQMSKGAKHMPDVERKGKERRAGQVHSIKEDLSNDASGHDELCNSRVRDRMPGQGTSVRDVPLQSTSFCIGEDIRHTMSFNGSTPIELSHSM
jgi:hypothetical protein